MVQADSDLMKTDDTQDQASKGDGNNQRSSSPKIDGNIDIKLAEIRGGTLLPETARSSRECEVNVVSVIFVCVSVGIVFVR